MLRIGHPANCLLAALLLLVSNEELAAEPNDHRAVLTPFVNDNTFAIVHVDLSSMKVTDNPGELFHLLPKLTNDAQSMVFGAMLLDGFIRKFQDAGGQSLYIVAGLGDIYIGGGPVVVATARQGKHPEEVAAWFRQLIQSFIDNPSQKDLGPLCRQLAVQQKGDAVLIGTKPTVARYAGLKPAARNDLTEPLVRLTGEGAMASAIFCPGPDFRRVVSELWPELPGSLAPLKGELARRWQYLEAAINASPDPKPRIALQTNDTKAAAIFVNLVNNLPNAVGEIEELGDRRQEMKQLMQSIVEAIPPKQENGRVTMTVATDPAHLEPLKKLFTRAIASAEAASQQRERTRRFRDISLALLNFESAKKHLPPAAIRDKDGRPLLSWRVAILPYLEQGDLYKQFHLDEPWGSPHNRALIEKMPGHYMGVGPKFNQLNREGKTTYQVPVGPETIFYGKEGTRIREITDGTAKTILLVEVEPSRAAIWTKPDDWEVDLAHPRRGVERSDRKRFVAAWCDGSVRYVPTDADEAKLRALLTRKGGEVVDSSF